MRLELGADPLRRSVEYALARAITGQSKGHYSFLRWVFRQCLPDSADADTLWRWCRIFGIYQKTPTPWQGTYRFTGEDGETIPLGRELVRSDGATYTTDVEAEIGEVATGYVDVAITATEDSLGATANNEDDQPLSLATPIDGVDTEGTVQDTTHTGADIETPEEGLERLLLRLQTPPSGGGPGDYVRWALELDGVTRAWEFKNLYGPNTVGLAFVRDNDPGEGDPPEDIIPDETERAAMDEHMATKAPITVTVTSIEIEPLFVDFEIAELEPDTSAVRAAITVSLTDFFLRESEPAATLALSRLDGGITAADGEESHVMNEPSANVVPTSAQLPMLGDITYV